MKKRNYYIDKGRRSIRLKGYDYTSNGSYFVTICSHERQSIFGEIKDGVFQQNHLGLVAQKCWLKIPKHHKYVGLDEFVIMPNHIHGILWIEQTEASKKVTPAFAKGRTPNSLGTIIATYKAVVTKEIRQLTQSPHFKVWHRNYYDVVIRDDEALYNFRRYIQQNPLKWQLDEENPENIQRFRDVEQEIAF